MKIHGINVTQSSIIFITFYALFKEISFVIDRICGKDAGMERKLKLHALVIRQMEIE